MARHNIVFGRDQAVQQGAHTAPSFGRSASSGPAPGTQWSTGFDQAGAAAGTAAGYAQGGDQLESMYARPAATGHDTGRMTMRDALNAITATLGTIVVIGFVVAVMPYVLGAVAGEDGLMIGLALTGVAAVVGLIGGLVLALVNSFKKTPSPILVLAYAAFEGLALGGISGSLEQVYPGIAMQAVVGTLVVAGVVLVAFRFGVLRTTPRLTKIFGIAMIAYMGLLLVNLVLSLITGAGFLTGALGLLIGGIAVVMASYSLVMDFEDVQRAESAGAPRVYAWRCAFGLAVTMVWLYIEVLRILAILRGND
ncbi:Bax inhibitor-1/YccA family protein [Brachybacterium sp. J144]|uniref:Bax inhibitor-1/YccA family protein n=1 Tax=Brachybacterium sp. J144 TaxID=3116487 RepID=UPI002E76E735|nr:Bax inhibitor-1/YccA family protein [Brachybacterium sp. J144]MEE1651607.1 Bax inhibitor-1/YccA family protein [Brachybacterium sp. J144]